MSDENKSTRGGIQIGKVLGGVSLRSGGDIVAGDKVTTTTTHQYGFRTDGDKDEFQRQLDLLRQALREIKGQIEASDVLSADDRDEASALILQNVNALKEVKEKTASLVAGQKAAPEIGNMVESNLDHASNILEKLESVTKKGSELTANITELAVKYGPLILSARHLFGLP